MTPQCYACVYELEHKEPCTLHKCCRKDVQPSKVESVEEIIKNFNSVFSLSGIHPELKDELRLFLTKSYAHGRASMKKDIEAVAENERILPHKNRCCWHTPCNCSICHSKLLANIEGVE